MNQGTHEYWATRWRTEKVQFFMHGYANLCIIMHATDIILFSSLQFMITKAHVESQPDRIRTFRERWTNIEYYNVDSSRYVCRQYRVMFKPIWKLFLPIQGPVFLSRYQGPLITLYYRFFLKYTIDEYDHFLCFWPLNPTLSSVFLHQV